MMEALRTELAQIPDAGSVGYEITNLQKVGIGPRGDGDGRVAVYARASRND